MWLVRSPAIVWTSIAWTMLALSARAMTIQVQFASGTLFTPATDATAKAAISAAAADLGAAITSSLGGIPNDMVASTVGQTTATFDWDADYKHPVTGATIPVDNGTIAFSTVKMFVAAANLTGSALGQGGPNISLELSGSSTGGNLSANWPAAVTNASNLSEAAYTRGGNGPVIGNLSGSIVLGEVSASYSVDYGVNFGNVWFDVDTDNSGAKDTNAALENFWHFDHTTPVEMDKADLYSVALHEMLHALGIGSSITWNGMRSGTTWNGPEVQAIIGSGANLIQADGKHIKQGTMSARIFDGFPQEVVMDPSLTLGTRKSLTWLDLAFLRDINFTTIEPSPPDYDGDGDVDGADLAYWNTWYGINANGDANGDGVTDGRDFLVWQRNYTGPLPLAATTAATAAPEPTSLMLLMVAALGYCCKRGERGFALRRRFWVGRDSRTPPAA